VDKLQGVVRDVVEASLPLSNLAQNLRGVTEETQRTIDVQQKSATNAKRAVDTMSGSVDGVAHSAAQAASDANKATTAASEGRQIVQQTVTSIQQLAENVRETADVIARLESDSNKVGSVLDVIKGIAEQTNLLALNAAIEAARAGEQGRGFAVVADEVRTLANRTHDSTEEIEQMIGNLQKDAAEAVKAINAGREQVQEGVQITQQVSQQVESIREIIERLSDINEHIVADTEQQDVLLGEVANSLNRIVALADSSAQSTRQSNESTMMLDAQTESLRKAVERFHL